MNIIAAGLLLVANGDFDHMDGGWWIVMGIGMLLFWGLVIAGIVWLVREVVHSRGTRPAEAGHPDALAVLDRRLAEGEISPEEYRERRAVLRGESDASSRGG